MAVVEQSVSIQPNVKPLPPLPITYDDFLEWADEDTLAEWVDGEIEFMSPASGPHQDLAGFLYTVLREFVGETGSGVARHAPFQMRLPQVRRGREPDVLVITTEHLSHLHRNYLDGPADLVIEVISPESVQRDWQDKYWEYEAGGVGEYWILDADAQRAHFFVRNPAGKYQAVAPDARGRYDSVVLPGFWINIGWLWQSPLPSVRQILQEWEQAA